jgi:hypothetical protein
MYVISRSASIGMMGGGTKHTRARVPARRKAFFQGNVKAMTDSCRGARPPVFQWNQRCVILKASNRRMQ